MPFCKASKYWTQSGEEREMREAEGGTWEGRGGTGEGRGGEGEETVLQVWITNNKITPNPNP